MTHSWGPPTSPDSAYLLIERPVLESLANMGPACSTSVGHGSSLVPTWDLLDHGMPQQALHHLHKQQLGRTHGQCDRDLSPQGVLIDLQSTGTICCWAYAMVITPPCVLGSGSRSTFAWPELVPGQEKGTKPSCTRNRALLG